MKLIQFTEAGHPRVGLLEDDGSLLDLTATPEAPTSIYDIYYACGGAQSSFTNAVESLAKDGERRETNGLFAPSLLPSRVAPQGRTEGSPAQPSGSVPTTKLRPTVTAPPGQKHLLRIWLAGVTHEDSARLREVEARQHTGQAINVYDQKYRECAGGGIPESFAKTDPDSCVAHGDPIARPDTTLRLVPETELVSVYALSESGQVERIGFTGGNDYTDNGIEAANPLNLPQAKNWSGGCASLGPVLVTDDAFDHSDVTVSCEVVRDGSRVAYKEGGTGSDNLNMPDGLFHLERSLFQRVPLEHGELQVLFWGTPIVFSDADLADGLLDGDLVRMHFSGGIGQLENTIRAWSPPDQLTALRG